MWRPSKGKGYIEKTDKIDAKVIRQFGEQNGLHLSMPRTQLRWEK